MPWQPISHRFLQVLLQPRLSLPLNLFVNIVRIPWCLKLDWTCWRIATMYWMPSERVTRRTKQPGARIIFGVLSVLTWQQLCSCRTFLKRSTLVPCHEWIYTFHFIFLFEESTYLLPVLHQEDAKSISKSTFDSPSHWGISLHYEKKQGPECERPFLRALSSRSRKSGISIVVE